LLLFGGKIGQLYRLIETQIGSVGGDALPLAPRDSTNNYTTTMWTSSPKKMEKQTKESDADASFAFM
jgi:hypothetical protein